LQLTEATGKAADATSQIAALRRDNEELKQAEAIRQALLPYQFTVRLYSLANSSGGAEDAANLRLKLTKDPVIRQFRIEFPNVFSVREQVSSGNAKRIYLGEDTLDEVFKLNGGPCVYYGEKAEPLLPLLRTYFPAPHFTYKKIGKQGQAAGVDSATLVDVYGI